MSDLNQGYDSNNDLFFLTENDLNDELNENIYEDYTDHMQINQTVPVVPCPNQEKATEQSNYSRQNPEEKSNRWLFIFLLILIIALAMYYLIDKKIIELPSFESKKSILSSPSSSIGETFMKFYK